MALDVGPGMWDRTPAPKATLNSTFVECEPCA
jgi:hypothetical protein